MSNTIVAKVAVVCVVIAAVVFIAVSKQPPAVPEAPPAPIASPAATQAPRPLSEAPAGRASLAESSESVPAVEVGAPATPVALPRLLELGSTTCIPCKQMVPVLDALRSEYGGRLTVEFIDVLADRAAGERYRVEVIPTQVFFDAEGKELGRHQGYWPKEEILNQFAAYGVKLEPGPPTGAAR